MPRLKKTVRPIGTTIVLTLLIWTYADQINNDSIEEFVSLSIAAQPGSDLLVELQEPASSQLRVTFSGPRAELEKFRTMLGSGQFKPVFTVAPEDVKEDTAVRDSAEVVASFLRKDFKAIAVRAVTPAQIKVFVDRQVTVKMPVKVLTGATKTTNPVVQPGEVNVTLPRSIYQNLYDIDKFVVVDMESELRNKSEDLAIDDEFAVSQLVMGQQVTTDPTRVRIQLRVQQQSQTRTFEIPHVEPMGPAELFAKYRVEMRDPAVKVELKGPAEVINALKPQAITAYIHLDQEDMARSWTTYFPRDVQFVLPEGVKLNTDKMARPPSVDFKLVELQAATPAAVR